MSAYPVISPSTSSSGGWRLTAMLGAVAFALCAGILSWVIITVADLKSGASGLSVDLSLPSDRGQPNIARNDVASFATNLSTDLTTGESGRTGVSSWESDMRWLGKNSFAPHALDQASLGLKPALEFPDTQPATAAAQPQFGSQPEPSGQQIASTAPEAIIDHPRRLAHAQSAELSHVAAVKPPHKAAIRPSYLEKMVEQGDAGDVTFRYRRRTCSPSNMVDVCFMPAENRRAIVVERW
jgi:hypothetical protein